MGDINVDITAVNAVSELNQVNGIKPTNLLLLSESDDNATGQQYQSKYSTVGQLATYLSGLWNNDLSNYYKTSETSSSIQLTPEFNSLRSHVDSHDSSICAALSTDLRTEIRNRTSSDTNICALIAHVSSDLYTHDNAVCATTHNWINGNFYTKNAIDNKVLPDAMLQLKKDMLEMLYPVGSLYVTTRAESPATLLKVGNGDNVQYFGTWQQIAKDQCIQGASESHQAGTTVNAGLPEINATIDATSLTISNSGAHSHYVKINRATNGDHGDGSALHHGSHTCSTLVVKTSSIDKNEADGAHSHTLNGNINVHLSKSPLYGRSETVQPAAYVVNIWRRVS